MKQNDRRSHPFVGPLVGVLAIGAAGVAAGQVRPGRPTAPVPAAAPAATDFQPNQKVEAREGDAWSPATVLKKEGRRLQIKYDDGTEEWVTPDRLRVPGAGGATAPKVPGAGMGGPAATGPASKPAAKPPVQFAVGAKVEVAWAGWTAGTVKNRDGNLYLVVPDSQTGRPPLRNAQFHWMWAHVSMVRAPGDATVKAGFDTPVTVGNSSVTDAKTRAAKQFADLDRDWRALADAEAKEAAGGPAAKDEYAVGLAAELRQSGFWRPCTVKERDGDLYLVAEDDFPSEMHWQWVHVSMVRRRGQKKDGFGGISGVTVGNSTVAEAKAKAAKQFADIDQKMAAERRANLGRPEADKASDNPFASKSIDKPVTPVIVTGFKDVTAGATPARLAAAEAIDPALARVAGRPVPFRIARKWGVTTDVMLAGPFAVAAHTDGSGSDIKEVAVERLNLTTGALEPAVPWNAASVPVSVSPTGRRVLGRPPGFHSGTMDRLDLWDLPPAAGAAAAKPAHVVSFCPYDDRTFKPERDVEWAALTDDDHVLTCNSKGDLACWKVGPGIAAGVWRTNVRSAARLALSPGGRRLACMTDAGLAVLDVATGDTLAFVEASRQTLRLAFSPDGKRVVGVTYTALCFWDLDKGTFGGDLALGPGVGVGPATTLAFADDGFVLVGSHLFDLSRKVLVWKYDGAAGPVVGHAGRIWTTVSANDKTTLVSAALPHDGAKRGITRLPQGVDAGAMVLRPGVTVTLEVSIDGPADQQKATRDALAAQLAKNGIAVADGQPIKIVAKTENGATKTQAFKSTAIARPGFQQPEVGEVSVTEKITRVYVEMGGKKAWEDSSTSTPYFVTRKEGQSIADAVSAANTFNLSFLKSVLVPSYVPRPEAVTVQGTSVWAPTGLKENLK